MCFNPYTDYLRIASAKRKRRRPDVDRAFLLVQSWYRLFQTTQRITAIATTTRARHPTNVMIVRSLITGSLRIMSSTEMPHLVTRHMHAFCSATKPGMNLWLTLNFCK